MKTRKQKIAVEFTKATKDYLGDGEYETTVEAFADLNLIGRTRVGEIVGTAQDVDPAFYRKSIRIVSYDVRCILDRKTTFDAEFCVGDREGEYPTARAALAAAKQFVRDHAGEKSPVEAKEAEEAIEAALRALKSIVAPHRTMQGLGGEWGDVARPTRDAASRLRSALKGLEALAEKELAKMKKGGE